jgi:L-asparaginase
MHSDAIRIFVTGGTFDKEYNELTGALFFKKTHLADMLRLGRCRLNVKVRTLLMIDSLEMTDAQREMILRQCVRARESRIVITHGTDSMRETAAVLGRGLADGGISSNAIAGKTIVLTGAMVPYTFGSSDGIFNLGTALAFVQALAPGVYVSMNGKCFAWHSVRKNRQLGIFEAAV